MFVGAISKVRRKAYKDRFLRCSEIEVCDAESRTSRGIESTDHGGVESADHISVPRACTRGTCRLGTCVRSAAL